MRISKAVITAAGRGTQERPSVDTVNRAMLPLVDRDGTTKPVLQIIAEEALASGIEEICVVCAPGDEAVYRARFHNSAASSPSDQGGDGDSGRARGLIELERRLRFTVQPEAEGYGHAVWCARSFVGDEPFLLLLSDHVYISDGPRRCARQLIDLAISEACAVSAVQSTREHLIHQYGTISGRRVPDRPDVYVVDAVVEKPGPTLAELELHVPGLRAGHYLCYFGMHVLTPSIFEALDDLVRRDVREHGSIQLSTALDLLARRERCLALEARGARYNLGAKYGAVEAQIALALSGPDRDEILALLLESLARIEQRQPPGNHEN